MASVARKSRRSIAPRYLMPGLMVCLGTLSVALHWTSLLAERSLARLLVSEGLWRWLVGAAGGKVVETPDRLVGNIEFLPILSAVAGFSLFAWLAGGACIARSRTVPFRLALHQWGTIGWVWWLVPLVWELLDLLAGMSNATDLTLLLRGTLPLWEGIQWAGWLTTGCALALPAIGKGLVPNAPPSIRVPRAVWLGMLGYFVAFGAMNWGLYNALHLPHGDSAMYEEHLWNLLHGKGFRSYLDAGRPFLGEHVQVIHLALIPAYLVWPSHVLLELCQSLALAAGAALVYRIAFRHSHSTAGAAALALAYLFYVPLQFLDIAVDFKTFRPNSFEIPLFLLALDALEEGRWRVFGLGMVLALLCQEDAATIVAPLGVWIACRGAAWREPAATAGVAGKPSEVVPTSSPGLSRAAAWRLGIGLALFGTLYVILVIKVILPWFRDGADVHFAQYFNEFGDSSDSIVASVLQHPGAVVRRLLDVESILFGLALLAPVGFVPLLSPGRLSVAAPLFAVLCLSDITNSPQHHFHAPLIPIVFWAAAAGLRNLPVVVAATRRGWRRLRRLPPVPEERNRIAPSCFAGNGKSLPVEVAAGGASALGGVGTKTGRLTPTVRRGGSLRELGIARVGGIWTLCCSVCIGVWLGLSPASISFWDPHSSAYWSERYVAGERSRRLPAILAQIPRECRVASTDYLHPRLTHHARSYDYSAYRPDVPDDADYILIDLRGPHSGSTRPEKIKELGEQPDEWELLPDVSDGYFALLKRRTRPRVAKED